MKDVKIYPVSSMTKIFPDAHPSSETHGSMLKNETYSFQIAVESGDTALCGATLRFGGDLAERISFYPVRSLPCALADYDGHDGYVEIREDGMYPELCEETVLFDVRPHETVGVWVTVSGAPKAGRHEIPVALVFDDTPAAETSYMLTVTDAQLPAEKKYITNWMHYDCIAELHGVPVFSDDFYHVFDAYLRAYVEMGNTMLLIPTLTPALDTAVGAERMTAQLVKIAVEDGRYLFDFSDLDRFIDFVAERGVRYFEFAHLFTQWGAEFCPKVMATVDGKEKKIFGWDDKSDGDAYRAFLSAYLPALSEYLHTKGIAEASFIHLSDEPTDEHLERYIGHYKFVKPLIGDIRTIDALSHYAFAEKHVVDMPVSVTTSAVEFRDHDAAHMSYTCCQPYIGNYSNRFFCMTGERTRVIGFQIYLNGALGFLHWGYNFYHTKLSVSVLNPYTDTSAGGAFPGGDSFVVYPDTRRGGVQKSIRYHMMHDAFQDLRALELLESRIGRDAVVRLLHDFGLFDYNEYPHSARVLHDLRNEVNRLIGETV